MGELQRPNLTHSANQRMYSIKVCANDWLGMNASIRNIRANCITRSGIASSQLWDSITINPSQDWPFQQIVIYHFYVEHFTYLVCTDRLTSWLMYHLKSSQATNSKLISFFRYLSIRMVPQWNLVATVEHLSHPANFSSF